MNQQHMCEHEGCVSIETQEYHNSWAEPAITEWLCYDHAIEGGYCLWCQNFAAGSEDYDFSHFRGGAVGYHVECFQELREETGEFEIEDGYEWDMYGASWFDPDSGVSELEPEDTPRETYIGPGSEYEG